MRKEALSMVIRCMARIGYDRDEYFNVVENGIFVDIGIEFDIEAYKFLS